MAKFEIYLSRDGQYRWRLKAANGEIIATSEGYTTKYSARRSAEGIKITAPYAIIIEI